MINTGGGGVGGGWLISLSPRVKEFSVPSGTKRILRCCLSCRNSVNERL